MMRRPSTIAHGPVAMPPLAAADRLRVYRRCFHELEEQLLQLQLGGRDPEVRRLQAEVRFLEELIMVFTELNPVVSKSKQTLSPGDAWTAEAAVEGLDLSLVTDILMLSATSPWTVYIAERSQWLLCYVSSSTKRTTGWTPQELVGTAAWSACHPDDIPTLQRMLHLRDSEPISGGSVIYRRMRKDRSYATVQATGRAVGTRWYAWVEQDILNFSPVHQQEEFPQGNQREAVTKAVVGPKAVVEGSDKIPTALRARRHSTPWAVHPSPEVPNPQWEPVAGAHPLSALTPLAVPDQSPSQRSKGKGWVGGSNLDAAAEKAASEAGVPQPADQPHVRLQEAATTPLHLYTEAGTKKGESGPTAALSASGEEAGSLATVARLKAAPHRSFRSSAASSSAASNQPPGAGFADGHELLKGRKVLLVEDDAVNRKIGQRLLQSLECNVTVTCNGQEALDVLQRAPPDTAADEAALDSKELPPQFDLVLMDLQMPVMDGTHAVQLFREWEEEQEPARKRMTIFALTANVSDRDMVKCAQSGFDEFVSKPLTVDKLIERLLKKRDDAHPAHILALDS